MNKFKPKYKVHYDKKSKIRSVTIGDNPQHYYISKVVPQGTTKPYYLCLPSSKFKAGRYYPTVRDAVFAIVYTMTGAI